MSATASLRHEFSKGFLKENPVFALLLGLCPALAVTTSAINGLGMGLATMAVLLGSNLVISIIKNFIPDKVRIPCYIVIIATFVTIIDLSMGAYLPDLHEALGIFIPLIVVNCVVLGRAEAFASRNSTFSSLVDAISMGLGFSFALTVLGAIREVLGFGTLFDLQIIPEAFPGISVFILPPGAFLALGFLVAGARVLTARLERAAKSRQGFMTAAEAAAAAAAANKETRGAEA
ncbi:MAG: electron transport complex subunit E [Spirochaetaceae bacterium]|nr:MAG: electron transport complex subunit E [Spirochaetaceae bacterium]